MMPLVLARTCSFIAACVSGTNPTRRRGGGNLPGLPLVAAFISFITLCVETSQGATLTLAQASTLTQSTITDLDMLVLSQFVSGTGSEVYASTTNASMQSTGNGIGTVGGGLPLAYTFAGITSTSTGVLNPYLTSSTLGTNMFGDNGNIAFNDTGGENFQATLTGTITYYNGQFATSTYYLGTLYGTVSPTVLQLTSSSEILTSQPGLPAITPSFNLNLNLYTFQCSLSAPVSSYFIDNAGNVYNFNPSRFNPNIILYQTLTLSVVPEPSTLVLATLAAAGLAVPVLRRRLHCKR